MKRTENILNGVLRKEISIFISRSIDNIEIVEATILFGTWTIKETVREVYLPNVSSTEPDKLKVIADAYEELHATAIQLLKEELAWSKRDI